MGEGQQTVEQGHGAGVGHAKGHHLRLAVEGGHQQRGGQEDDPADGLRQQRAAHQAEFHPRPHPVEAVGPQVLADEGRQGQGKAGHRQKGKALNTAVGTAPRHGGGVKGIDIGLDNDVGQRDHRALHPGGDAQGDDLLEGGPLEAHPPPVDPIARLGEGQLAEGQEGGQALAEDGGQGGAAHPQFQYRHKEQVQHHVGEGGGDEVLHGAAAVPHRLEDAGPHVVEHHGGGAEEVDPEVEDGVVDDVGGGADPLEDLGG